MPDDPAPVLVAFDGSPEAQAAVEAAAQLFPDRRLVIASVWEPGLALTMTPPSPDLTGLGFIGPSGEQMAEVDRSQRDRAQDAAETGARLAAEHGATAEPLAVTEEGGISDTLADVADQLDASAVVVGSRGLGRVKARLLGSTSNGLLKRLDRPVVVVKAPED